MEIIINKAILHVLDTHAGIPVLSKHLLTMSLGVKDYIEKHLLKSLKDSEIKRTVFRPSSRFQEKITAYKKNPTGLVAISQEISQVFFDYMSENIEIPSADLIFVEFDFNHEKQLGIFKFNYKQGYIHCVTTENGLSNDILIQPCVLPTNNQRLEEFVIINLMTDELMLKEKKYSINDEKKFYISTELLLCEEVVSEKEAFDIVQKTAKKMIASEYNGDVKKLNLMKQTLADDYEKKSEIDINNIAKIAFEGDENIQSKFKKSIEEMGLYEEKIKVSPNIEKKIYGKQKFITETGIEISIPSDQLNRKDSITFINHMDGTISVEIKNIAVLNSK